MKIKTSFVTNSSTTSFVVMGNIIEFSEFFEKNKERLYEYYKENIEKNEAYQIPLNEFSYQDIYNEEYEICYYLNKSKVLQIDYKRDSENIYIGIPYTSMGEDETLKEFKERVKTNIKENFNMDINPFHIEEAWSEY